MLVLGVALGMLVLGGCRGTAPAGSAAASPPVPATGAAAGGRSGAPDPLADVEAAVGAAERDLDVDSGVVGR
jgi:hypothetical protein